MTPAHFIQWPNWVLLGLNLVAEISVVWVCTRKGVWKFLAMLPAFAAVSLLADIAGTILLFTMSASPAAGNLWQSEAYSVFYWSVQIGLSVLTLLLALQIVTLVLPPWKALISLVAIILFTSMAGVMGHLLPSKNPSDLLSVLTISNIIAILALPGIWLVRPSEWPKGIKAVVTGLVTSTLLQVGCAIGSALFHTQGRGLGAIFTLGVPAASLIGMCFFWAGVRSLPLYAAVKKNMGNVLPLSFLAAIQNQRRIFTALRGAHDPGMGAETPSYYRSIGQSL